MDRRRFLATASATLAAATLPSLRADDKVDAATFELGAQSYTFREFDLEGALKRMKELGLKYGEFYQKHCPVTDDAKKIQAFLDTCKEYDVTPRAWGVQGFTKDHDANKKLFDFGKALGLKMFSADPTPDSF